MSFIQTTEQATFTVYTEAPAKSGIVQGTLEAVSEDDQTLAAAAIAENAVLPMLNVSLDRPLDELAFEYYRLRPESVSGRAFGSSSPGDGADQPPSPD